MFRGYQCYYSVFLIYSDFFIDYSANAQKNGIDYSANAQKNGIDYSANAQKSKVLKISMV
ncbi:hypothetical protein [Leptothoe spongobia]|uniref:hypothetical protein n=1 Tax=Leptothoe spongobia TaxID=2651728 RepID=UPI001C03992B|nr:hypothetical protein [Leptothoe spongobia]